MKKRQKVGARGSTANILAESNTPYKVKRESSRRELPAWMKSSDVLATEQSLKKPKLRGMASNTIYIMSDDELLDTAKGILSEAGVAFPQGKDPVKGDIRSYAAPVRQAGEISRKYASASRPDHSATSKCSTPDKEASYPISVKGSPSPSTSTKKDVHVLDELFRDEDSTHSSPKKAPRNKRDKSAAARQTILDEFLTATPPKRKRESIRTATVSRAKYESQGSSRKRNRDEHFVPETASQDMRDNSIILTESQDDSIFVADSMSQNDEGSLVICSSSEEEFLGDCHPRHLRKASRAAQAECPGSEQLLVTTIPESNLPELCCKQSTNPRRRSPDLSILDGIL